MPLPRPARLLSALLLGPALSACGIVENPPQTRGQVIDPDQIGQIVPGTQTRADVAALLGTPSLTANWDNSAWYYVTATTRRRPMVQQSLEDQTVVAVRFDEGGVVREVKTLTLADAQITTPVGRSTPVPGNDRTLLQEVFGNIGRFGPAGSSTPGGLSRPSPGGSR